MFKKILTVILAVSILALGSVAYAANTPSITAAITGLKIFFNGAQLKGDVLTAKGVTYVPMDILSNNLGFKLSTDLKTNKLTITEKVSKEKLIQDNEKLQVQIAELNKKLRFYSRGKEDYTGQSDSDYFSQLVNANSIASAVYPMKKNQFVNTPRDSNVNTYYKVDLQAGEAITAVLKPRIDKDYMYLKIYDSQGSQISSTSAIYNGRYGALGYAASKNTTVYVVVTGVTGTYSLGVYDQYFNNVSSQNDERDFFGSAGTSKKIANGTFTRDDPNLEDWYRIDLESGQTLNLSITPQIDKNYMYLKMYDNERSQIASTSAIYNGRTGIITKKVSKDSTYYISVTGTSGSYSLNYSVN